MNEFLVIIRFIKFNREINPVYLRKTICLIVAINDFNFRNQQTMAPTKIERKNSRQKTSVVSSINVYLSLSYFLLYI